MKEQGTTVIHRRQTWGNNVKATGIVPNPRDSPTWPPERATAPGAWAGG